jgi:CDP-4-dehydro-6-deoxyglucose reductase
MSPSNPVVIFHPQTTTVALAPGETLLGAAQRIGLRVPHSCRGGQCGSCRMVLREGAVDYPRFGSALPPGLLGATPDLLPGTVEVLACQAVPSGTVRVEVRELRRAGEVEVRKLPCRVARREELAPGVVGLWLRLPAAEPLAFHAGQYVNLWLGDGRSRPFSIAAPPHAGATLELHVRESPSMAASGVLAGVREGSLLTVEGPFGELGSGIDTTVAGDGPVILVAGGTGYAPMQCLLRAWLESGSARPVHLYWGVRAAADLYRDAWLRQRMARFPQFRYVPVLSAAAAEDGPAWRRGWIHEAVEADWPQLAAAGTPEVVVAGPTVMVEAVGAALDRLQAAGQRVGRFTSDRYG